MPPAEVNGGPWMSNRGGYSRPKPSVNLRRVNIMAENLLHVEIFKGGAKYA